jgi:hypothetical protein
MDKGNNTSRRPRIKWTRTFYQKVVYPELTTMSIPYGPHSDSVFWKPRDYPGRLECKIEPEYNILSLRPVTFPLEVGNSGLNCISSWTRWLESSGSHRFQHGEKSCAETLIDLRPVPFTTMPTECDGVPRISLDLDGTQSWTNTTIVMYFSTKMLAANTTKHPPFTQSIPTCKLDPKICHMVWNAMFPTSGPMPVSILPTWFPEPEPSSPIFGCLAPKKVCRHSAGSLTKMHIQERWAWPFKQKAPCGIHIGRAAYVHWPMKVVSADLCGYHGRGKYTVDPPKNITGPPIVVTMSELTIRARQLDEFWPKYEIFDTIGTI